METKRIPPWDINELKKMKGLFKEIEFDKIDNIMHELGFKELNRKLIPDRAPEKEN